MRRIRLDGDAAFWMAVAWVASAFALWPVMVAALGVMGHPLDETGYTVATGAVMALCFAVTAFVLVRERPWRTFPSMILTLYVIQFAATAIPAAAQVGRTPDRLDLVALQFLEPISFGLLQPVSYAPVRFGIPDVWALVGLLAGMLAARALVAGRGGSVGVAARPEISMMRMPKP